MGVFEMCEKIYKIVSSSRVYSSPVETMLIDAIENTDEELNDNDIDMIIKCIKSYSRIRLVTNEKLACLAARYLDNYQRYIDVFDSINVAEAVWKSECNSIEYMSDRVKDMVFPSKRSHDMFPYLSERIQNDVSIIKELFKSDYLMYEYLPDKTYNDTITFLYRFESEYISLQEYLLIPKEFRDSLKFQNDLLDIGLKFYPDDEIFPLLSDEVKCEQYIKRIYKEESMSLDSEYYATLSDELKRNDDIINIFIEYDYHEVNIVYDDIKQMMLEEDWGDADFMLIKHVPRECITYDIILNVVRYIPEVFLYLPIEYKTDKNVILNFVENIQNLEIIMMSLPNVHKEILKQGCEYYWDNIDEYVANCRQAQRVKRVN